MKYIVLWTIITNFIVPCQSFKKSEDVYGRETMNNITYALACYDSVSKEMSKEFNSYYDALEFVKNGKIECLDNDVYGPGSRCSNWRIIESKTIYDQ